MTEPAPIPPNRREPRKSRRLTITLSVSLGLHVAAALAVLLLLRPPPPAQEPPAKEAEVELVMEEHQGDAKPTTPPPAPPSPSPVSQAAPPPPSPSPVSQAAPPPPSEDPPAKPPVDATAETPRETEAPPADSKPAPDPAKPAEKAEPDQPAPPRQAASPAPTITLSGTDSPSDARAFGDHILPARPDAVFHNQPPVFPYEAAQAGAHGMVIVLIHVSPGGHAAGVDVVRSSGYVELDQSARDAVSRWRFLPAVHDGQPVASEMVMRFYFDNQHEYGQP